MTAVLRRELGDSFRRGYGFLLAGALLLLTGVAVFLGNLVGEDATMAVPLLTAEYALVLWAPIHVLLSARGRRGAEPLYLSLPVSDVSVSLGIYLAQLAAFALPWAVLCLYPPILRLYGHVSLGGAYWSLGCLFLLGAALIAVCSFLSDLIARPVWGAVAGFAALVLLLLPPFVLPRVPDVLIRLLPFLHFERAVLTGLFDLSTVLLLLSYALFFLFLTILVRASRRRRPAAAGGRRPS